MRKIICLLSDTHGGYKYALMRPGTTLFDETEEGALVPYTPALTESQKYLWKLYEHGIEALKRFAKGDEILLFHNGDLTHGDKHKDALVSTRKADQIIIACENLHEIVKIDNITVVRIATGTEAHNFNENTSDILVGREMHRSYPGKDISVVKHGLIDWNDVPIDYAHHGPPPGSRNWLKGNEARYYLRSLMMDDIAAGKTPPKLVTRAHVHVPVKEFLEINGYDSWLVVSPSYSMINDYARKAGRSPAYVINGMTVIETIDGEIGKIEKFHRKIDIRRREIL